MSVTRMVLIVALSLLSACSIFRRDTSCREPVVASDPVNLSPLKPAAGLDAPDTRNAVRIPDLNEPERARNSKDSCLSSPPSYGSS